MSGFSSRHSSGLFASIPHRGPQAARPGPPSGPPSILYPGRLHHWRCCSCGQNGATLEPEFSNWLGKVLANERRRYIRYVFSHWLWPCLFVHRNNRVVIMDTEKLIYNTWEVCSMAYTRRHLRHSEIIACVICGLIPNILQLCLRLFTILVRQLFKYSTACQLIEKKLLCYSQDNGLPPH